MSIKNRFFNYDCIKNLKKLAITSVMTIVIPSGCFAVEFMLNPSFGLDFGGRCMRFRDLYGRDHFAKKHYHYFSPYLQVQLLKHVGIQVGFEQTEARKTLKQYRDEEPVLGNIDYTAGGDTNTLSTSKAKGKFIGLNFNSNVLFTQHGLPIELSVFAGISMTKIYLSFIDVTLADLGNHPLSKQTTIINSTTKVIPKASFNLKYILPQNNKISLKIGYGWEKTSSITVYKIDPETKLPFLVKPKDSHLLTIGFIYSI